MSTVILESDDTAESTSTQHRSRPRRPIVQARLKGTDRWIDYVVYGILLGSSVAGNVAAFNGGFYQTFTSWNPLTWSATPLALWGGILYQTLLQWRQFANAHNRSGWRYRGALLLSGGGTLIGFGPAVIPYFATKLTAYLPVLVAYGIVSLVALILVFGIDLIQEELIVEV